MIRTSFMVKWRANSFWMDNVVEWTALNRRTHRGSQRALNDASSIRVSKTGECSMEFKIQFTPKLCVSSSY